MPAGITIARSARAAPVWATQQPARTMRPYEPQAYAYAHCKHAAFALRAAYETIRYTSGTDATRVGGAAAVMS
eukprot:6542514-Pyramimonas_sp.AAC.1